MYVTLAIWYVTPAFDLYSIGSHFPAYALQDACGDLAKYAYKPIHKHIHVYTTSRYILNLLWHVVVIGRALLFTVMLACS